MYQQRNWHQSIQYELFNQGIAGIHLFEYCETITKASWVCHQELLNWCTVLEFLPWKKEQGGWRKGRRGLSSSHQRAVATHTSCYSHKYCSFSHRFYRAEAQTQSAVRFFQGRSAKITELKKTSRQKPIPHCLQVSTKRRSKTVSQHKQGWQEPSCIYNNCLFVAYWGSQAMHKEIRVKKKTNQNKKPTASLWWKCF